MRINSLRNNNFYISPYNFNVSFNSRETSVKPKLKDLPCDVFTRIGRKRENSERIFDNIISHGKKFDIDMYNALSKDYRNIMLENCLKNRDIKNAAEINLKIGTALKKELDDDFGKDSYVFVSVGTSPSCLARILEFSGVETKYLPASYLRWIKDSDIECEKYSGRNKKYGKFLEEQNLTNEYIEKSGKKYLFYDYTLTGKSLNNFKKIMEEVYGLKSDKIQYRSLNADLIIIALKNKNLASLISDYIQKYLLYAEAGHYGGISHLPFNRFNEIDLCNDYYTPLAQCYNFLIMSTLDKKKLLKNNPKNKTSL